jgi:hypothetical protein
MESPPPVSLRPHVIFAENQKFMSRSNILLALAISLLLYSCKNEPEEKCVFTPDVSAISVNLDFQSLEDSLPAVKSKQQLVNFFSHHVALRDIFFNRPAYPDDSVFINTLYKKFSHPSMDTVLMDTKKVFGDDSELKNEFKAAFANIKYYYPAFKIPRIETVITGVESDLFVSDSLIIVGLDFFAGSKAKYRPDMHSYILKRYEKNFIVPSAMLLYGIDTRYNKTNLNDRTVMAEMITYGKAYYFARHMLPCVPDSVFMGYTSKETAGAYYNQDLIWKRLVDDEALFSTSNQVKQRFIGERPKTYEVGNECPGRIGRWVGWQIVKEYEKHNTGVSLQQLMAIKDPQTIFKGSKYRPDK